MKYMVSLKMLSIVWDSDLAFFANFTLQLDYLS